MSIQRTPPVAGKGSFEDFLQQHLDKCEREIVKLVTNVKKKGRACFSVPMLSGRLAGLEKSWQEAQERHEIVLTKVAQADREKLDYFQEDFIGTLQEAVYDARDFFNEELAALQPPPPAPVAPAPVPAPAAVPPQAAAELPPPAYGYSPFRLPETKIPRFKGDPRDWFSFRDLFRAVIIDNRHLSDAQRLQQLRTCVEGAALRSIVNLEICDRNFQVAWNTLERQFAKERVVVKSLLAPLRELKTIKKDNLESIEQVTIDLQQMVEALRRWDCPVEYWSILLVDRVTEKFDESLNLEWEESIQDTDRFPTFERLVRFLEMKAGALRSVHGKSVTRKPERSRTERNRVRSHTNTLRNEEAPEERCFYCRKPHALRECEQYMLLTPGERYKYAKTSQHCILCLSSKHLANACPSSTLCQKCDGRHHTLLHFEQASAASNTQPASRSNAGTSDTRRSNSRFAKKRINSKPTSNNAVSSHCGAMSSKVGNAVLLATALVRIHGPNGKSRVARALLDQGSEASFISTSLVDDLQLVRHKSPAVVTGLGGDRTATLKYSVEVGLGSVECEESMLRARALVVSKITAYTPPQVSVPLNELFNDLKLADPEPISSRRIDMLLGADIYALILKGGIRRIDENSPIAQDTMFGWVLSGPCKGATTARNVRALQCNVLESLDEAIRRFWEVEAVPMKAPKTLEEEECEAHFSRTVQRTNEGRFVVRLPFKVPHPEIELGDSLRCALSALTRLRKKLDQESTLVTQYSEFLAEYESMEHMTKLRSIEPSRLYIPHRAVVRAESMTTKLRVVFNASSVTSSGRSLNDLLHIGPKLQRDITIILTNWRLYQFVMVADIEKMFRQILVAPEDRRYQCILWRAPKTEQLTAFELNTVTYGTACAPYLSMRTLLELVREEGAEFPLAVPVIEKDVYIDDVFISAPDKKRVDLIRNQVCQLLQRGGFHLRKWAGNSADLLRNIPISEHSHAVDLSLFEDSELKVLGLRWVPSADYFYFNLTRFQPSATPPTKRSLFSEIAKLYDPLGWLSPVVVRAKILMQSQWLEKIHWDQSVSMETHRTWNNFCEDWIKLNNLRIPRWIGIGADVISVELHGFCDASLAAYAAAVYIRVTTARNKVVTSLLIAKSRVAPIKTLTVPVLELNGALLLAELLKHVASSLAVQAERVFCWTDSTITLAWIKKHPSTWKLVIANRVSKIQTTLPTAVWRHVPTRSNPADLNSRGVEAEELLNSKLWTQGPSWLQKCEAEWPVTPASIDTDDGKRVTYAHVTTQKGEWELLSRFSKWSRLLHVVAYCIRFYRILKGDRKKDNTALDFAELQDTSKEFCESADD
ncbi:uncharacterized protein LOC108622406 [Ceratina calcarata]|uniref:Uncharacterized protein LOC108622406 n=1 Tax=Ceratina calcarata TaxID=156304 RepID=A0AAJ7ISY7_9HYME|nr:uncharacterized protein LOC108622406 [Ceratina calcarata]